MARYSVATVSQKLLAVQAGLAAGKTVGEACKAAGVSPGTYKTWCARYKKQRLPYFVTVAPQRGVFLLSQTRLLVFDVSERGFQLGCFDAERGVAIASCVDDRASEVTSSTQILAASANSRGDNAVFVTSDGRLYSWDTARSTVESCSHDLRGKAVRLSGRAGSGVRRWSDAAASPDLAYLAYWESLGEEQVRLGVMRLTDGKVILQHDGGRQFIPCGIAWHPTKPLVGVLDASKLITLLDVEQGKPVLEKGPQAHSLSFSSGNTLLFDDWYGRTQELDYKTKRVRDLAPGWGSEASMGDRFITATDTVVDVWRKGKSRSELRITFEQIEECALAGDASRLALRSGPAICVWNLG